MAGLIDSDLGTINFSSIVVRWTQACRDPSHGARPTTQGTAHPEPGGRGRSRMR